MVCTRKLARVGLSVALLLALSVGAASALGVSPGAASVSPSAMGVRATGMGGAYTAISSDVSALVYNPAGIGQKFLDLTITSSSPTPENLEQIDVLFVEPINAADLATLSGYANLKTMVGGGLGPFAVGVVLDGSYDDYGQNCDTEKCVKIVKEAIGGMGFRVAKVPLGAGDLRLGFAAHAVDKTTYTFVDGSLVAEAKNCGQGFYFSAGAMATITPWVTLGVTATDLAKQIVMENGDVDTNEPMYTAGAALKIPFLGITLAADADTDNTVRYGAETNLLFNLVSLRVGQIKQKDSLTVNTGGLSLNLGPLSAGFAAQIPEGSEKPDQVTVEASIRF